MSMARDSEAKFQAVFTHLGAVTAYARRRGSRDADGLAAEVMTIAWRRLADVPNDDPRPWLYATARNLLLQKLDAPRAIGPRRRSRRLVADALEPHGLDPELGEGTAHALELRSRGVVARCVGGPDAEPGSGSSGHQRGRVPRSSTARETPSSGAARRGGCERPPGLDGPTRRGGNMSNALDAPARSPREPRARGSDRRIRATSSPRSPRFRQEKSDRSLIGRRRARSRRRFRRRGRAGFHRIRRVELGLQRRGWSGRDQGGVSRRAARSSSFRPGNDLAVAAASSRIR